MSGEYGKIIDTEINIYEATDNTNENVTTVNPVDPRIIIESPTDTVPKNRDDTDTTSQQERGKIKVITPTGEFAHHKPSNSIQTDQVQAQGDLKDINSFRSTTQDSVNITRDDEWWSSDGTLSLDGSEFDIDTSASSQVIQPTQVYQERMQDNGEGIDVVYQKQVQEDREDSGPSRFTAQHGLSQENQEGLSQESQEENDDYDSDEYDFYESDPDDYGPFTVWRNAKRDEDVTDLLIAFEETLTESQKQDFKEFRREYPPHYVKCFLRNGLMGYHLLRYQQYKAQQEMQNQAQQEIHVAEVERVEDNTDYKQADEEITSNVFVDLKTSGEAQQEQQEQQEHQSGVVNDVTVGHGECFGDPNSVRDTTSKQSGRCNQDQASIDEENEEASFAQVYSALALINFDSLTLTVETALTASDEIKDQSSDLGGGYPYVATFEKISDQSFTPYDLSQVTSILGSIDHDLPQVTSILSSIDFDSIRQSMVAVEVMTCPELEFNLEAYFEALHSKQKSLYEQMEAHGTETDTGSDYGFWFINGGFIMGDDDIKQAYKTQYLDDNDLDDDGLVSYCDYVQSGKTGSQVRKKDSAEEHLNRKNGKPPEWVSDSNGVWDAGMRKVSSLVEGD